MNELKRILTDKKRLVAHNFGGGALNDRFGPKKISFLGVILFGVGIFLSSCV